MSGSKDRCSSLGRCSGNKATKIVTVIRRTGDNTYPNYYVCEKCIEWLDTYVEYGTDEIYYRYEVTKDFTEPIVKTRDWLKKNARKAILF